jgi:hypothetical protein
MLAQARARKASRRAVTPPDGWRKDAVAGLENRAREAGRRAVTPKDGWRKDAVAGLR